MVVTLAVLIATLPAPSAVRLPNGVVPPTVDEKVVVPPVSTVSVRLLPGKSPFTVE